jgi:hypothetical protein
MSVPLPIVCPACGAGAATGLCTLTLGEVETLVCGVCDLYVRDGVLLVRGEDLYPDDVIELGRARAPLASTDALYVAPEARPVRLLSSWPARAVLAGLNERTISSVTIRFGRRGVTR